MRICPRSLASKLERGSSIRQMGDWLHTLRAKATRCRWPPESSRGLRFRYWVRPSISAASSRRRFCSLLGTFFTSNPKRMLSFTVMWG